jgi:hypothetical protein
MPGTASANRLPRLADFLAGQLQGGAVHQRMADAGVQIGEIFSGAAGE